MTKLFSIKLLSRRTPLGIVSWNWQLIAAFAVILYMPVISSAQYSETFSTPNKGYLLNCVNDLTTVNWTMTPWDPTGSCQISPPNPTTDLRDPSDYFQTTAAGVMESVDLDQEVCWESPLMNISTAGTVSLAVDLSWVGFDVDVMAGGCLGDYIRVSYSVNGGAYVMVPNVVGGNPCATIAYLFSGPPGPHNGNTTVTQGGISGNTLKIRVCGFTNANAEMVTIDNVSVPQMGVTTGCAAPILTTVVTQVGCSNPNSGAINLTVTGGTPTYTYDWSNDGPESPDNDPQDLSGLAIGTYTVTVTDAAGCSATTSATITNAPSLSLSTLVLNTSCGGLMDGEVDLIVSGGVPGYTYDWNNDGAESPDNDAQDLIGVGTGTYIVTVTDASGCSGTASATISVQPSAAYLEQFNTPNKGYLPNFVDDFSAVHWTMSSWAPQPPAAFGRDVDDLFRTSGGVLVGEDFDQDVCWTSPLIGRNTATQFSVNLSWTGFDVQTDEYINVKYSIDGGSFITIPNIVGGGAGTIQYSSGLDQSGSQLVTQTGLTGSNLQIQICGQFNSNNESMTIDNVSVPGSNNYCPAPTIMLTASNVSCAGGNNGSILVTANSGMPGYNVSWSGPSNGNPPGTEIPSSGGTYNITSLVAGTYTVTVTDANGLTASSTAMVTQPAALILSTSVTNATCTNSTNGAIDLTVSGGAPSYSYNWGGGIITQDRINLAPGTYTVTVTDANGCTSTTSAMVIAINPVENASFAYSNSGYCQAGTDPTPVIYGNMGGMFSAPAQVVINATSGQIDVSASTVGGPYVVTYTTSGPCPASATFSVAIVNCQPGATLTDMLTIDNGTVSKADPGDRIKLTATISNSQSANYEGVQLALNNDPRVTFVTNSFKSTPVAVNDAYTATMNTLLTIPVGSGLLLNDFDDNIPGLTVTSFDPTSSQGGTISVNPNGSFTYTPMTGFTGDDTFNYTITDSDMQTNSGTVKIHVQ